MEIKALSQRDERWKLKKLGFSNLTIGSYGCTLTCLTMLINYIEGTGYTPDVVNQMLKDKQAFTGALIIWAYVPRAFPKLKFIWRGYNYDNLTVSWYVYVRQLPVMVEVNGAQIGGSKHWVLFKGNKQAVDPWTGTTVSTSHYPVTGYSLFQRG